MTELSRLLILALTVVALLFAAASVDATPRLQWLNRVPVARSEGESKEARTERLSRIEAAITRAARGDRELIAALVVLGSLESAFALHIGQGKCRSYECDRDPDTGRARARGYWQAWAKSCPEIHRKPGPVDVNVAATCAANLLRYGRKRCGGDIGKAMAVYAGLPCNAMLGKERGDKVRALLGKRGQS